MKRLLAFLVLGVVATVSSCTHEYVYYRTKTYPRRSYTPTTTPGLPYSMPDPGAPSNFSATR